MICEVEGWACSLSAKSLDRFANESAEDFTDASKPVVECSSFLLAVKLTFLHVRKLGLLWF